MTEPDDSIDVELAAFERLRLDLDHAIAACQAEHDAGRIGYEAYRIAKARQEKLLVAASALERRLAEALNKLTGVQSTQVRGTGHDQNR